jgi:hypothetical protein
VNMSVPKPMQSLPQDQFAAKAGDPHAASGGRRRGVGEVGGWGGGGGGGGVGIGVGGVGGGWPDKGRRVDVAEDSPTQKSRDRNFSDDGAWQVAHLRV